ncbi:MAG: cytochrome C [Desulfobacteraceae bacterium IS3]|nr:MAG: cytochrome C [Desulfobacteraceae bacterium IS3]
MKTKGIILAMIGMLLTAVIAIAAEQSKGAKDMELSGGDKGKVAFPHQKHQEVLGDCKICHDVFPQEPGSIEKLKAAGKLEKKQVMNKQCVKCHKEKENAGVKTGPTACSKCHQK